MELLLQLLVAGVWTLALVNSLRRLVRLARVSHLQRWDSNIRVRSGLNRIWWWLGREEFWHPARYDVAYALQISLLVFLFVWHMAN
ncbi:MAG: hypothetical protein KatS3mg054_0885 [Chloroflexus sp.]|jgi:hypothetical protein|uniref:Uncharacterized protein n=1 Tax=Chloroflexus aurantiacus (strain ATCC 29366 / DSM 635 / J-10-fl) TaxID=324602 RepID=A9WI50_CHLAA|nr:MULTISPECIES: hypothetical protein [Chloroflexus]ABY35741.1 conserved hypothetical protein [Chloroflexus aurantiacus J-10-fl]GIV86856.1 MAG: hypothetical protein KatS3mg054_0885 [Chloroflexus sp.]GIV91802.1 MAG: hypothetical protein KatS3mg056_0511 [Chloroflexus sp.]HBW67037.1 hypothetical protein [Chloroflexus aurantiacus]